MHSLSVSMIKKSKAARVIFLVNCSQIQNRPIPSHNNDRHMYDHFYLRYQSMALFEILISTQCISLFGAQVLVTWNISMSEGL